MSNNIPIFPNQINRTTFLFETSRWTLYLFLSNQTYILYLFDSERTITGLLNSIQFNRTEFDSIDADLYEWMIRASSFETNGISHDLKTEQFTGEIDGLKYMMEICKGLNKVKLSLEEYIIMSPVRQLVTYFPIVENIHKSQLHNHLLEEYIRLLMESAPPDHALEQVRLPKEFHGVSIVTLDGLQYYYHFNLKDDIIILLMPGITYEFSPDDLDKFQEIKSYKDGKLYGELENVLSRSGLRLVCYNKSSIG